MRRLLLAFALLLAVAPVAAQRAQAFETWCYDDPVVELNGQRVSIDIGVQGEPAIVKQSVQRADIVIMVPKGVRTRLVSTTDQYFREHVRFVTSDDEWHAGQPVKVAVAVRFSATATLPTAMTVTTNGATIASAQGTTASGMWTRFTLP